MKIISCWNCHTAQADLVPLQSTTNIVVSRESPLTSASYSTKINFMQTSNLTNQRYIAALGFTQYQCVFVIFTLAYLLVSDRLTREAQTMGNKSRRLESYTHGKVQ